LADYLTGWSKLQEIVYRKFWTTRCSIKIRMLAVVFSYTRHMKLSKT